MAVTAFSILMMASCKKTETTMDENKPGNDEYKTGNISVTNGIVNFSSFATYLKTVENKDKEQAALQQKLNSLNFVSLKRKSYQATPSSFTTNTINSFTNAFDSSLYTDYLLSILNTDKICIIDGFWIKVDLDNQFCDALDSTLYPNEYNDLKNNVQTNNHIMHFLSQDEPVLEALKGIRDGSLTWAQYQEHVSRKGGQGICFRQGVQARTHSPLPRYNLTATAQYLTGFISFELSAAGKNSFQSQVYLQGRYDWEGSCKNSDTNVFTYWPISNYGKLVIYSGGSSLYKAKVETTTYNRYNPQFSSLTASIYY